LDQAGWKRLNLPAALEEAVKKELSAAAVAASTSASTVSSSARPKSSAAAGRISSRGGKGKFPKAQMRQPPTTMSGIAGVSTTTISRAVSDADADTEFDPRSAARPRSADVTGGQTKSADDDDFNPRLSADAGSAAKTSTSVETDMHSLFGDLPPRSSTVTLPGRPFAAGSAASLPGSGAYLVSDPL
jgi:hypothetical protein